MAITKRQLSGSTSGQGVNITSATSGSGTTVHTSNSVTGANTWDEAYLWGTNTATGDLQITIEFGGTSVSNQIIQTIPYQDGLYPIITGLPLHGSAAITAFATATHGSISLYGYVNRLATG